MNEQKLTHLVYVLIALVSLNLAASAYLLLRPAAPAPAAAPGEAAKSFPEDKMNSLARQTVKLYNAREVPALYATFDGVARMQFSEEVLREQVNRLHSLIGTVDDYAFSHVQFAGLHESRPIYTLHYKVRLKGGPFASGELRLTIQEKKDDLALMGFFLNGSDDGRGPR